MNHNILPLLGLANQQISDLSSQNQMLTELNRQGLIDPDFLYPNPTGLRNGSGQRSNRKNG